MKVWCKNNILHILQDVMSYCKVEVIVSNQEAELQYCTLNMSAQSETELSCQAPCFSVLSLHQNYKRTLEYKEHHDIQNNLIQ